MYELNYITLKITCLIDLLLKYNRLPINMFTNVNICNEVLNDKGALCKIISLTF